MAGGYCRRTTPPAGPRGWRNLGEQPVVETPWFRLCQARVELPAGRQLDHYLLRIPPLTMTAMLDAEGRVLLLWRHRFIPGIRHITFAVEDIEDVLARLHAHGAELVGELEQYEDSYRLCYVRGPEGITVELAEQLS
jgi:catechol 2,3-dioxygenase-like lactoylglutathione lyase family enzyme